MSLQEKITKLLSYELDRGGKINTSEFKIIFDTLCLTHCESEHLSANEKTQVMAYKDKVWKDIELSIIQFEYLTQNKIVLPLI